MWFAAMLADGLDGIPFPTLRQYCFVSGSSKKINRASLNQICSQRGKKFMKTRFFAFIVLITVVVTGIFISFSSYHNHNNDFTIPFVLSVVFALAFSILPELKIRKIVFATTIGVKISLIIKFINCRNEQYHFSRSIILAVIIGSPYI